MVVALEVADVAVAGLRWSLGLLALPHGLNKVYYDLPGFQRKASTHLSTIVPGMPQPAAVGLATLGAGLQTAGALAICVDFYTGPLSFASMAFYGVACQKVWKESHATELVWMQRTTDNPGKFKSIDILRFGPGFYMAGYGMLFGYSVLKKEPEPRSEPVDFMR
mmetsp:Transcript_96205/g.206473  ORF Transcript_96205/g.206473 Transcript_96205/m.206473 type:complete len:164 (-) Transcript_96205:64-555(-)|eukprot:CAMPEP_0180628686 /NCGR_PEP_ID=MMETSP1037_2-20121125/39063_1 /TAXON_ID=632150 /ORGANISM="Azadinium spinosum, Strain 3D9" /LENGTH=163 /DNA_ID=CAMNT_0022649443 /DNA_START=37 /DNA_END=528 /DNA_ORIENTATION=+